MYKPKIQIINHHPRLTISRPYLKKSVEHILAKLGLRGSGVEITFVDDVFMCKQNLKFMHKKGTTDVLSFPQIQVGLKQAGDKKIFKGEFLGDILVSLDQAQRQAKMQGLSLNKEVLFLILHSILHLVGFDHHTAKEKDRMQKLESKVWKGTFGARDSVLGNKKK